MSRDALRRMIVTDINDRAAPGEQGEYPNDDQAITSNPLSNQQLWFGARFARHNVVRQKLEALCDFDTIA